MTTITKESKIKKEAYHYQMIETKYRTISKSIRIENKMECEATHRDRKYSFSCRTVMIKYWSHLTYSLCRCLSIVISWISVLCVFVSALYIHRYFLTIQSPIIIEVSDLRCTYTMPFMQNERSETVCSYNNLR